MLLQFIGQMCILTRWYLSSAHLFRVNHKLTTIKFGLKKLETSLYRTSLYRMVQHAFQYLEPFRCVSRVWRQTAGWL